MIKMHDCPNKRPIHPECPKLLSVEFKCLCDDLWEGWDGTGEALDQRIKSEWLAEARTGWGRPGTMGACPDADEPERTAPAYRPSIPASVFVVERGYWKKSEHLKTIRGDASWSNDRTPHERLYADDKLRLHIIERGYWGDCSGAELDRLRTRMASYQRLTGKS